MSHKKHETQAVEKSPIASIPEACNVGSPRSQCGPLPGTILRIFIPPGAVVNLLNLIEIDSPSGICLIIRIPLLGGRASAMNVQSITNAVQAAGGTVELS